MPYTPEHKRRTRQRIVGAAARLFNRKGFAVTIGEIMAAAGLTHGGFYRHFGSKEELYAEAVRQLFAAGARALAEAARRGAPAGPAVARSSSTPSARDHLDDVEGSCPLIGLSSTSRATARASRRPIGRSRSR